MLTHNKRQNIKLSLAAAAMFTVTAHTDKNLINFAQDPELVKLTNCQERAQEAISDTEQKSENLISQQISPKTLEIANHLPENPPVSLMDVD